MKILIEMTPEHYDGFLNKCPDDWSTEYAILKNGLVVNRQIDGTEQRMIVIYCDEMEAYTLLSSARILGVPAAEEIAKALKISREL